LARLEVELGAKPSYKTDIQGLRAIEYARGAAISRYGRIRLKSRSAFEFAERQTFRFRDNLDQDCLKRDHVF
jgi:hypothetical protein